MAVDVTEQEIALDLLRCCRRAWPARRRLQVSGIRQINEGWECEVYSFTLGSEEGGERRQEGLILRVYPGVGGAAKSAREFDAMRRLGEVGFAVPRMLFRGTAEWPLGRPFVVMERIDGPVMGAAMRDADEPRRLELFRLFCRLFVDLHAFDWRRFVDEPSGYASEGWIDRWLAWAEPLIAQFGQGGFLPALEWLKARRGGVRVARLSVTHGDYHPWNILLRPDSTPTGTPVIIDWTQADLADYRLDLAWTLLLMRTIAGPQGRAAMLAEYERLAGHRVPDLEYFEVMASVKRLFGIVVSLTQGPELLGMRAGAATKMREQVGHIANAAAVLHEHTGLTIPSVQALL